MTLQSPDPRPVVSVVMPTYNRAAQLSTTVSSVLAQSVDSLELVVVDDGSTDTTSDVLSDIAARDARLRVVRLGRNYGAPAARNVGLRLALGDWVALLDSDDQLHPSSIETRLAVARSENVEFVTSDYDVWRAGETRPHRAGVRPLRGDVYEALLRGPASGGYSSFLASTAAIRNVMPLDERLVSYQDWDLAIELARRFRFGFVEAPTFVWDQRAPGTISSDSLREAEGYAQVVAKRKLEILRELGPKALLSHYERLADLYAGAGDAGSSQRYRRLALPLRAGRRMRRWGGDVPRRVR